MFAIQLETAPSRVAECCEEKDNATHRHSNSFPQLLEIHAKMARIEFLSEHCMSNHFHLLIDLLNASESRAQMDDEEI